MNSQMCVPRGRHPKAEAPTPGGLVKRSSKGNSLREIVTEIGTETETETGIETGIGTEIETTYRLLQFPHPLLTAPQKELIGELLAVAPLTPPPGYVCESPLEYVKWQARFCKCCFLK